VEFARANIYNLVYIILGIRPGNISIKMIEIHKYGKVLFANSGRVSK